MLGESTRQHVWFAVFVFSAALIFLKPLENLIRFASSRDYGTHIFLVIPISIYLIFLARDEVFTTAGPNLASGAPLLLLSAVLAGLALTNATSIHSQLSFEIFTLVSIWISAFVLCYGTRAFRRARFALLFLLLLIPIPDFVIDKVIFGLQAGSASLAYWLFRLLDVPALREGFFLHLPSLDLEVARECSGIRSSLVLFVTVLLVGEFVLRSFWSKFFLILAIIPVVIAKNALRIVTIALLSMYVDRHFLHGWLHESGGMVFYLLGLLALSPILLGLRRGELSRDLNRAKRSA